MYLGTFIVQRIPTSIMIVRLTSAKGRRDSQVKIGDSFVFALYIETRKFRVSLHLHFPLPQEYKFHVFATRTPTFPVLAVAAPQVQAHGVTARSKSSREKAFSTL